MNTTQCASTARVLVNLSAVMIVTASTIAALAFAIALLPTPAGIAACVVASAAIGALLVKTISKGVDAGWL